ncbi:Bug family tripartite tricarboxylate transporter substrate binding protein [Roseomonas sp. CCTCC AB2023176]|uniref:Bug family tripartite tricarboxylate transporter substrate binding protein n=1 Tax=Roseomonas sp. CCTCC AB2023176 TaxID=3342640 RepID=UPI0035E2151E
MTAERPIIPRRAALAAIGVLAAPTVRAQVPDRPLRVVLGFPGGSAPDVAARLLAEGMREALPVAIVVDNRPGAGGMIAAAEVARGAPADGSTLLFGEVGTLAMAPSTYARLSYDPARDFTAVAEVAAVDFALAVPASTPAGDFAAYLAWRARGRRSSWARSARGRRAISAPPCSRSAPGCRWSRCISARRATRRRRS